MTRARSFDFAPGRQPGLSCACLQTMVSNPHRLIWSLRATPPGSALCRALRPGSATAIAYTASIRHSKDYVPTRQSYYWTPMRVSFTGNLATRQRCTTTSPDPFAARFARRWRVTWTVPVRCRSAWSRRIALPHARCRQYPGRRLSSTKPTCVGTHCDTPSLVSVNAGDFSASRMAPSLSTWWHSASRALSCSPCSRLPTSRS